MNNKNKIVCWWSGGATSAVACKIAIDMFGVDDCQVIMIDTNNEDPDTYRFKKDCEKWYGKDIETITGLGDKYKSIEDVWRHFVSLNVANGAICSSTLKRDVRVKWQKENTYKHQVFGYEFTNKEFNRALSMTKNHPIAKPIYPLLMMGYNKEDCIQILFDAKIQVPVTYDYGFHNNNCFQTGCVQGGIGYWQKMKREFRAKFDNMADMEHELTNKKGSPVTMLKDQSKSSKESNTPFVFLKKHPDYPNIKCIDDMKGREVKPLFECNGFCGTNDLIERSETEKEINYDLFNSPTQ